MGKSQFSTRELSVLRISLYAKDFAFVRCIILSLDRLNPLC
jgi:hypothetical protein